MESRDHKIRVLMLPWLAHGHISPFLELAKRLIQRNFFVNLCSTPVNIASIKEELTNQRALSGIQLVELHLPDLPNLPPHYHTTKSLPSHLMPTLKHAFDLAAPSFSNILNFLKPDLLIYDFIQPWAPAAASALNIPAVLFLTSSATSSSFFNYYYLNPTSHFPSSIINLEEHEATKNSKLFFQKINGLTGFERFMKCTDGSSEFIAIKTIRELESKYIDNLSVQLGKELVPVGPLLVQELPAPDPHCKFMAWLGTKETASTVFVSFGTEYFMSKEEIEEVAHGIELSMVNFIWVIRFLESKRMDLEQVLPSGFLKKIGSRGMVVEGWAPQAQILGHPSIGGFLTHCGWSSVLEAMSFGVPLVALPLQLDQPLNARLVEENGVGMEVKKRRDGKFDREEVARRIRQLVVDQDGEAVRRNVKNMGVKMRNKDEPEIEVFIKKLCKLTCKE